MNWLKTILILLVTYLAVFFETSFTPVRNILGVQIDLLPAIIVFASLTVDIVGVAIIAVCAALWFDSLSANPLGITILPLFIIGFLIHRKRELILREQVFAQFVLGLAASALVPLFTVLLLLSGGQSPLLGWGTIWQWLVMSACGGALTPVCFRFFNLIEKMFFYQPAFQSSFRNDREIRRGRR